MSRLRTRGRPHPRLRGREPGACEAIPESECASIASCRRETASYADIARAVGKPTATRAVGTANGQNPVAIVLPCRRIVGSRGALTGYGGGLDRKRWLLTHEGAIAPMLF